MTTEPEILYEKADNGVATITLNRPEKLNAFTHGMITAWSKMLDDASDDPEVKVLILTGRGRGFCTGGDVQEMGERGPQTPLDRKNFLWKHVHKIALTMERMEKPVIAAINGLARGAGCDMALMCHFRIAAESATFAWSYVKLNLIAGDGGAWYLPRIIGMPRALDMLITGRTVTAQEADHVGLVNRIVPDNQLHDAARAFAAEIADQPQDAVRFYLRAAYEGQTQTLYSHLDMVSSHMAVLHGTPEYRARVEAFRESRRTARKPG